MSDVNTCIARQGSISDEKNLRQIHFGFVAAVVKGAAAPTRPFFQNKPHMLYLFL